MTADRSERERAAVAAAGLRISDKHAMSRAGLAPMSLAGDCQGQPASAMRPGIVPMCLTCSAFNGGDKLGTLKPAAVRLPPGMEWGCVNWRGHAATVAGLRAAQVSQDLGGCAEGQQHTGGVMCGGEQRGGE